ncbi:2Fe-2S iron-sulfur cluster-binding protein [Streptomyces sp. Ncost-T10-10d]|uniref:2Fe-2S iron-sulfur cluster-binding protein n=1 Tax=Streptomyces sp. Ncost-T10-10d TaxID=1839774 RepID=UPI00210B23EE|nr:2Fe-2S iron-sulfur cluster-binding protein [Streptomyces sp. Ncost-T10-10d]
MSASSPAVCRWGGPDLRRAASTSKAGEPGPVQRTFAECGGFRCGYRTSGMITLTTALLREHPVPDEETIRSWISSHVCRCTGYR